MKRETTADAVSRFSRPRTTPLRFGDDDNSDTLLGDQDNLMIKGRIIDLTTIVVFVRKGKGKELVPSQTCVVDGGEVSNESNVAVHVS